MELKLIDSKGKETKKTVSASDNAFAKDFNEGLIHQLVTSYMNNGRTGTRSQKTRAEVRHTTKRPWAQKGTGRARAGMTSSPIWRGGGRAFPNRPDENFTQKLNKKAYRAGMRSILSEIVRQERLTVVEKFDVETPKTKKFLEKINTLGVKNNVLILIDEFNENLYLSSRNIPHVLVVEAKYADPVSLVHFQKVIATSAAIKQLEGMFA
ncbi:50S ribosomal protein L4 [Methylophilaceae bacterium]|jgi:large subunit ribosomal protein L4|nr:50S ribosomal protein L4 [Methylophilaceae bacterium]